MTTREGTFTTTAGALARLGFGDGERALRLLREAGIDPADHRALTAALGAAADPDQALTGLVRIAEQADDPAELLEALASDADLRARLTAVLGASDALTDHLVRHPGDWRELRGPDAARTPTAAELRAGLLHTVGADPTSPAPAADPDTAGGAPSRALRAAYHRRVLRLAGRDLTGAADLPAVGAELADLAAAVLDASLAVARGESPEDAARCRLAVIGMGKCGGRELNYVSDVDVVFVAEPADGADEYDAMQAATRLASRMMAIPAETDTEGTLWEVDAALRPEGKNGPLVRPLSGHIAYYERWAKTWEFQALLKARPVAGDAELGRAYSDAIGPMVWRAADRPGFVEDVQAMRRRVVAHIPAAEAARELKLGPGGLRDIEFSVQLLQLVHGRADAALRSGNTLQALEALSAGGYVGRSDAAGLASSYRFLRRVEHLLQLHKLRRTHLLPDASSASGQEALRRLGRALGHAANPVSDLTAAWKRVAGDVRRLHEKLFYRPLLNAVARLPGDESRLTPEQAGERLGALGFADPKGALRHLQALTSGVSRRASIQRTLLPVMLGWFSDAPRPDAGLLGFRQVSDALGATPWYLRLLRDDVRVAERMARVLGSSRYATDLLLRAPEAVAMLAGDEELARRPTAQLATEAEAALRRHDDGETAVAAVRALRRRELFRTAAADLLGVADIGEVGRSVSAISRVTVDAALRAAERATAARHAAPAERDGRRPDGAEAEAARTEGARADGAVTDARASAPARVAVIGMGRFGGRELTYASDADVMFVYEPVEGADPEDARRYAEALVQEMRRLLEMPAADPALVVDADLRPEGRSGPLVRPFSSYRTYYDKWAATWERQALLRAAPVAGDADLGARFMEMVEPVRYPEGGVDAAGVLEIRKLKARMEAERLPRGADPALHTKLGRGGLSDVEWVAQLIQLRHAFEVPELRTTETIPALEAAVTADLLDADDAGTLEVAWRLAARVRGMIMLVRGRPGDSIPSDTGEAGALAEALGYRTDDEGEGAAAQLLQDYRQATRRARTVMERVFYDG
ncbi:bifunctional [glutamine synthetase] adenylyltransferase/[glutamine synthetase]-adenylyl-L-tyrosine phosphorylase [Nocardiopsis sp. RSe5-2]|uniref:Bifunctional glutamine synthetase adenylyltransferase/adenylyl-removing enzyme n=1 Tax=Nocardiopsis endophytica TaxID=3018445 RepID=A0ABT4UD33_9ACTN|nr:bifunctional [glutamine synthetase] adenylyltransferase/[glutamine synthetase]-adenylyl-L-tyrosine phosphorylase [Nocardiopsis endophytica]MDA2814384.1 bifunctional [glutamine synthetase] adenylyltransferase/[glutamine synthetase]-adenylyl-L-tyrosine phosphorylase [Nocardiopsis endophytica]